MVNVAHMLPCWRIGILFVVWGCMAAFPDIWLAPGDLIAVCGGAQVEAWDFRDLTVGQLITINGHLLRPERIGGRVVEFLGVESMSCGNDPIVLSKYLVECI